MSNNNVYVTFIIHFSPWRKVFHVVLSVGDDWCEVRDGHATHNQDWCCRGDKNSVQVLLQQLMLFGQTSSLHINISKSPIYFGGVTDRLQQSILADIGLSIGVFPFRYLGVPLSPHRLLASKYSPLIHKLEAVIQGWLVSISHIPEDLSLLSLYYMGWFSSGSVFSLYRVLLSSKSPASVETSYGQAIPVEASLLLWLGKLFAFWRMKEVWVCLISKWATTVLLPNTSGIFIWSKIPFGLDGFITFI